MAGNKQFKNATGGHLSVTLFIRKSDNPANNAGTTNFTLANGESKWVSYGDNINIYLNGIGLIKSDGGSIVSEQEIVIQRGSSLDDQLNKNNTVQFQMQNNAITFNCWNS